MTNDQSDSKDLLNQAFALQQAGDNQAAEQIYHQVLIQTPDSDLAYADAAYMLGVLASKQQDYATAIERIQQAINCHSQRAIYHFSLGQALSVLERHAEACKAYEQALNLKPDLKNARFELAKSYLAQQAYEQATPHLQTILKANPDNALAAFHLGECLQAMNHHPAAIQSFKLALQLQPDHAIAWRNLGLSLQLTGKLSEAITAYNKALKGLPDDARIWLNLGNVYQQRGQMKKAVASYQQGLQREPNFADLYLNLGVVLENTSKLKEARTAFERFLQLEPLHPQSPKVWCHLGRVLRYLDLRPQALQCYERAIKMRPTMSQAFNEVGLLFLELNQSHKALLCFERSLELKPDLQEARIRKAYTEQALGELEAAEASYKEVLEMNPNHLMAYLGVAGVEKERGNFEAAGAGFEQILERSPEHLEALAGKAAVLEKQRRFQEAYDLMQPIVDKQLKSASMANYYALVCTRLKKYDQALDYLLHVLQDERKIHFKLRAPLYFRLGEIYDKQKQADLAFANFAKGNELKPHTFNMKVYTRDAELTMACFTPEFMAQLARANHGSRLPIFIFGMPRSGTTLTEQIICSHPDVFGAGELRFMGQIWRDLRAKLGDSLESWQSGLLSLTVADLNAMAQSYLADIQALAPAGTLHITDKMPANFQHLPLMSLLFPQASFIHCQRHPLDTCLSCFTKDFNHLEFTNDLDSLGSYYALYQKQIQQSQASVQVPVLSQHYEETVADQEAASRRLIAHCGLEWDPRCLDFHKTERHVKTASYDQVRNPIYGSSVARYKPYETYLQPIIDKIELASY